MITEVCRRRRRCFTDPRNPMRKSNSPERVYMIRPATARFSSQQHYPWQRFPFITYSRTLFVINQFNARKILGPHSIQVMLKIDKVSAVP